MKIKVENVAMIKSAEIEINGLTVIAGENNTGKSSIGKIIFSIFNSLCNLPEKLYRERLYEISTLIRRSGRIKGLSEYTAYVEIVKKTEKIAETILQMANPTYEQIGLVLKDFIETENRINNESNPGDMEGMIRSIKEIINLKDEELSKFIVNRYFIDVFKNQLSPLYDEKVDSLINISIQQKDILLEFSNNELVKLNIGVSIVHPAYLIDDPLVISGTTDYSGATDLPRIFLKRALFKRSKDLPESESVAKVIASEKLKSVLKLLQGAIPGEFVMEDDTNKFIQKEYRNPVSFDNLSMGVKALLVFRMLIEENILKENDVLILDEPEIHLHPDWQLVYAEAVVLLQKAFNLSVIITTHSPYFLRAIQVFAMRHSIVEICKYYQSESEEGKAKFTDVTNNVGSIFEKLANPLQKLENYSWEGET